MIIEKIISIKFIGAETGKDYGKWDVQPMNEDDYPISKEAAWLYLRQLLYGTEKN